MAPLIIVMLLVHGVVNGLLGEWLYKRQCREKAVRRSSFFWCRYFIFYLTITGLVFSAGMLLAAGDNYFGHALQAAVDPKRFIRVLALIGVLIYVSVLLYTGWDHIRRGVFNDWDRYDIRFLPIALSCAIMLVTFKNLI